jgi:hypothetical protein
MHHDASTGTANRPEGGSRDAEHEPRGRIQSRFVTIKCIMRDLLPTERKKPPVQTLNP